MDLLFWCQWKIGLKATGHGTLKFRCSKRLVKWDRGESMQLMIMGFGFTLQCAGRECGGGQIAVLHSAQCHTLWPPTTLWPHLTLCISGMLSLPPSLSPPLWSFRGSNFAEGEGVKTSSLSRTDSFYSMDVSTTFLYEFKHASVTSPPLKSSPCEIENLGKEKYRFRSSSSWVQAKGKATSTGKWNLHIWIAPN